MARSEHVFLGSFQRKHLSSYNEYLFSVEITYQFPLILISKGQPTYIEIHLILASNSVAFSTSHRLQTLNIVYVQSILNPMLTCKRGTHEP